MPLVFTNIIYIIVKTFMGYEFNYKEIISSFFTVSIMPNSWYMITIILFYIAFYIVMKHFRVKKAIFLVNGFTIIYMLVCYLLGLGDYWYISCISFIIGILWASCGEKFISLCKKSTTFLYL